MSSYLEICHCGNDKASHHEGKYTCLAIACECTEYRDRNAPLPLRVWTRPAGHPSKCLCYACARSGPPDTSVDGPETHPTGCRCIICTWMRPP